MVEVSPNQEWGDYNAFSSMGDAQGLLLFFETMANVKLLTSFASGF
jgi:hypothetical protein